MTPVPNPTRRPTPVPTTGAAAAPTSMSTSTPTSTSTLVLSSPRLSIDLSSALTSTLRTWLTFRDTLLAAYMSGTDETNRLEEVSTPDPAVLTQLNQLRSTALLLASQIADLSGRRNATQSILTDSIRALLNTEEPKFLLGLPDEPDSF